MRWFCPPFILLLLFLNYPANAMMSSTSFEITSSVISGGGSTMASSNFSLTSTLGQSSPLGASSGASYNLNTGFWITLFTTLIGDINGDGDIDLEDVITALQTVTGQSPVNIKKHADMDGDDKIGMVEVLMLLNELSAL